MDIRVFKVLAFTFFLLLGIIVLGWLLGKLANELFKPRLPTKPDPKAFLNTWEYKIGIWLDRHRKIKAFVFTVVYGLIAILGISMIIPISSDFVQILKKFKTSRQQRIEFLKEYCHKVNVGYEILNDGKSIYKCPDGKEYSE
jgi:hypothetical protein